MAYIDFAALKEAVSIEEVADLLGLSLKKNGTQYRCECPVHGGGERGVVITPSKNLYYCFSSKDGGDQLALYAHVNQIEVKKAAEEIAAQMGNGTTSQPSSTVNRSTSSPFITDRTPAPQPPVFDPEKFRQRLTWHDEMAKMGLTPEIAESLQCGYHPQRKRIYFALRYPNGEIAGFIDDHGKTPPQWIAPSTNVVRLKRA